MTNPKPSREADSRAEFDGLPLDDTGLTITRSHDEWIALAQHQQRRIEELKELFTASQELIQTQQEALTECVLERDALQKRVSRLTAQVEELEAECSTLASWQCPHTDGKEGLTYDEWGHGSCAKDKRIDELEEKHELCFKRLTVERDKLCKLDDLNVQLKAENAEYEAQFDALQKRVEELEAEMETILEVSTFMGIGSIKRIAKQSLTNQSKEKDNG